ncbi:YdcF family protein [Arcobacter arenosus]|uniref:YdcF family protein n=1 Tax=Arcobacter arenosus TaxID=2576037 RepID=A0A5R8XY70_9BACT|nr:YdcF family protein [Arcobacter arenosus]TLP36824.1 YdcF family protein [Arcobacter arenosus]
MKLFIYLFVVLGVILFSFLNLGNFLDATKKPIKADLIVSLGGNGISRLKTSIELQKQGYINSNIIVLTGYEGTALTKSKNIPDARLKIVNQKKYNYINFIREENLKNTAEEVIFVKKFMKRKNFKSVIFVTEPPHSRRVLLLANILNIESEKEFDYTVVESKLKYWNSKTFYKNKHSREYAFNEIIKIPYNLIKYGIFYNLGFIPKLNNDMKKYDF